MKIEFNHKTERTVTDTRAVTLEEFIEILQTHKPKEIWCSGWSSKKPYLVITEYLGDDRVLAFFNTEGDLTPKETTFQKIYNKTRYSGLADSYFLTEAVVNRGETYV